MGKIKASLTNGADVTGCWQVEDYKEIFITLHETQLQMDQEPQQKARHTKPDRRKSREYP